MSEQKKVADALTQFVGTAFQLNRLDELAKGSVFLKIAYAELIGNVNYSMLHEPAVGNEYIAVGGRQYPLTLRGRKAAIAESFRHFSNKLDDFLSTANIATLLGSMDLVSDISRAALMGTKVSQNVKAP